ncbi:hypothetical protein N9Y67_02020 [Pseudomonadota bacterium]|nr:hypothetical protein [Pseudomonadota bacterium]
MAENDEESEVTPNDEDEAKTKKGLSLSKPLLIKIGIGVAVVLILAGAAYFFLASDEEVSAEDAELVDEESDSENTDTEQMSDEEDATIELPGLPEDESVEEDEQVETDIDLPDLPDDTAELDLPLEEGDQVETEVELPELLDDTDESSDAVEDALASDTANLEPALNQLDVPKINEQTAAEKAAQSAEQRIKEAEALAAQIKAGRYSNIYEDERRPYPWTREPKSEPMPEPKWGEFERAVKP